MNLFNEIGGYFELELSNKGELYPDAIKLNCARNCLRYIIRAYKIKEIYVPYYTCPAIWRAINKEHCKMHFYHIDRNFLPSCTFDKDAFILYTNYFGICSQNIKKLSSSYKNLIVDNAQAFYSARYGLASFNSPRKFFGISDGGYLFCDKILEENFEQDTSYQRFAHLLKRSDCDAALGYEDFCINDDSFENEPIKKMSNLTRKMLSSINYEQSKAQRLENFNFLHKELAQTNSINSDIDLEDVPMAYPYLVEDEDLRKRLLKNNIYVYTYWSKISERFPESKFQKYLLPLPIDNRYGLNEMKEIVKIIEHEI